MSVADRGRAAAEDELVFACLDPNFDREDARRVSVRFAATAMDWDTIADVAVDHGIGPLMYVNLRRCADAGLAVPPALLQRLRTALFRSIAEHKRRMLQLQQALAVIQGFGQDAMLLKGAALDAVIYANPEYALSLDIDILVRCTPDHLGPANAETVWDLNLSGPFEVSMGMHHDLDMDGLFPVDYPTIWQAARRIDVQGLPAWVMDSADLLVFACINSCRKRFFHPRNLYALRALLESPTPLDWDAVVCSARAHGCECVVFAALECVRHWLEIDVPTDLRVRLRVGSGRASLICCLVRRMSFTPLAVRTRLLRAGTPESALTEPRKWQRSILLPFACYSWSQILRRLRWLAADD